MEVAAAVAAVECSGAEVGAAYAVLVAGKLASVVGFGANAFGLAAVLPSVVCNRAFICRVDVSLFVVGVYFVGDDVGVSSVAAFTEGWDVFSWVVSSAVTTVEVPDG